MWAGGEENDLEATTGGGLTLGRVSYTHGGGMDRPLAMHKEGYRSLVPHETWRGQFTDGTCVANGGADCGVVPWPGWRTTAYHAMVTPPETENWRGGLVDGMRDATGQMYRRNRYYDPQTGQFTQPDPIGLAGGLNSYGFAAGDPVTYSDPYGLNPCLAGPVAMRACIAAITVTSFAAGRALEQAANNYSSGRPLGEGVGSAALRGANEGAVLALGGEGAGALAARFGVRGPAAAGAAASTSARTFIREGDGLLGIVHQGKLIEQTHNITLGHAQFVERTVGSLPAGAEAVTIGKFRGEITVTLSRAIHGRAMPASREAHEAARALFR